MKSLQLIQSDLNKHNIEINIELDSTVPHLIADQIQLQQVLLILLRNSIEAMEHQRNSKNIFITCYPFQTSMVEFFIEDTGLGISKDLLNNLISPCESSKPNGLGMGLCICNFIITSNGGTFWHDTDYSSGTRIKFRIPIQQSSQSSLTATA